MMQAYHVHPVQIAKTPEYLAVEKLTASEVQRVQGRPIGEMSPVFTVVLSIGLRDDEMEVVDGRQPAIQALIHKMAENYARSSIQGMRAPSAPMACVLAIRGAQEVLGEDRVYKATCQNGPGYADHIPDPVGMWSGERGEDVQRA